MIVDEAMHKLEMLDDPFLDQATELPTDLPFANDDEDSGCSGIAFKNLLYWFIFTKQYTDL